MNAMLMWEYLWDSQLEKKRNKQMDTCYHWEVVLCCVRVFCTWALWEDGFEKVNYWFGPKVCMVLSIKQKTHFSFSPITSLIWIFRIFGISTMWCNVDCSQLMSQFDHCQLQLVYPTTEHCPERNLQDKIHKPLLTRSISHSTFSIHCTNLFLHFSCVFTFLEIIKLEMLPTFFHPQC